jgi:hypothetical protein
VLPYQRAAEHVEAPACRCLQPEAAVEKLTTMACDAEKIANDLKTARVRLA